MDGKYALPLFRKKINILFILGSLSELTDYYTERDTIKIGFHFHFPYIYKYNRDKSLKRIK